MAAFFMFQCLLLAWLLSYSVEGHGQQHAHGQLFLWRDKVSAGPPGDTDVGPVPVHGESMLAENMTHVHERGVQTVLGAIFSAV